MSAVDRRAMRRRCTMIGLLALAASAGCARSKPLEKAAPEPATANAAVALAPPETREITENTENAENAENAEKPAQERAADPASTPAERLWRRFAARPPVGRGREAVAVFSGGDKQAIARVVVGRERVFFGDTEVARTRCWQGRVACPEDRAQRTDAATWDIAPAAVEAVGGVLIVPALSKAAVSERDKSVAIIADSRVQADALALISATLQSVGARPVLTSLSGDGDVVVAARLVSSRSTPAAALARPTPGVPATVAAAVVEFGPVSARVALHSADRPVAPEPTALHGDRAHALRGWLTRIRGLYPTLASIVAVVAPSRPFGELIDDLDTLRTGCPATGPATGCSKPAYRFDSLELRVQDMPPSATAGSSTRPPSPANGGPQLAPELLRGLSDPRLAVRPSVPVAHDLLQMRRVMPANLLPGTRAPGGFAQPAPRPQVGGPPVSP